MSKKYDLKYWVSFSCMSFLLFVISVTSAISVIDSHSKYIIYHSRPHKDASNWKRWISFANILLTLRIKYRWFPSIKASGAAFLIATPWGGGSAPLLGPDEPASDSLRKGANGNWIVLSVSARSPACLSSSCEKEMRETEREKEREIEDGAWQASCVVSRYSPLPDRAHNVDVMFITGSVRCFRMSRRSETRYSLLYSAIS